MRLFGSQARLKLDDSGPFFAVAATQMRRILVDYARQGNANKPKGIKIPLEEGCDLAQEPDKNLVALDDALNELAEIDPEAARVVELLSFGGYTDKETAEILRTSFTKVRRDWEFARSWRYSTLEPSE